MIRYYNIIFYPPRGSGVSKRFSKLAKKASHTWETSKHFRGYLDVVTLHVMQPCEKYPSLNMDEHCELQIIIKQNYRINVHNLTGLYVIFR